MKWRLRSSYSAGILEFAGERTVSALVQHLYSMDFINDNAGCFANGGIFPKNGRIIKFGSHRVYFGTVPVRQRLSPVLVAPDPPRTSTRPLGAGGTTQKLLANGAKSSGRRELNLTLREYNAAHGFASVSAHAARIPENRLKARNLDQDLRKEVLVGKSTSASISIVEKPKYSSPDKTIKAAKAAVELCESLSGDALAKQQERVRELLETIEQQNAEQLAKLNKAAASKSARSTKNAGSKSHGQASSPIRTREKKKMR
ncbi:hypothetical protein QYE76_006232 [Lolium multiflorum]|uniref:Uncharacterized protein n=1 Tax=Lolium multiflorum TaxID=4521 RepID=A0AAD8RWB5_LOLMU|nr:hypothetical protein QYE76_006232 [Lolium multiflorum]